MSRRRKDRKPKRTLPPQPGLGESAPELEAPPQPSPPSAAQRPERAPDYSHVRQDLKRITLYAALLFTGLGVLKLILG